MNRMSTRLLCAAALTLLVGTAADSYGQCDTCATPVAAVPVTVGYAPTVTYTPYDGWYPGKLLDRLRMRRWERNATVATAAYAPTYTAAYAPAYTAAYAPAYTASYAPTTYTAAYTPYQASTVYSASYAPYVTAYAPLQRPVVQTSYYQPAVLSPVVSDGCSACSACEPCSACSTGVSQAVYDAGPAGGCASCATGPSAPLYDYGYGDSSAGGVPDYGQQTPRPELAEPPTAPPANPQYSTQRPLAEEPDDDAETNGGSSSETDPAPLEDDEASIYPRLLQPTNDQTARRPTVDVWNAVYHKPVATTAVSTATAPAPRQRTQAEIDADPWHGASR